jgi:hypothetical protein
MSAAHLLSGSGPEEKQDPSCDKLMHVDGSVVASVATDAVAPSIAHKGSVSPKAQEPESALGDIPMGSADGVREPATSSQKRKGGTSCN